MEPNTCRSESWREQRALPSLRSIPVRSPMLKVTVSATVRTSMAHRTASQRSLLNGAMWVGVSRGVWSTDEHRQLSCGKAWMWEALTWGEQGEGCFVDCAAAGGCCGSTWQGPWSQLWSPACAICLICYVNNNVTWRVRVKFIPLWLPYRPDTISLQDSTFVAM